MLQTTTTMEEVMTTVKPRLGVTLLMREPMVTITCSHHIISTAQYLHHNLSPSRRSRRGPARCRGRPRPGCRTRGSPCRSPGGGGRCARWSPGGLGPTRWLVRMTWAQQCLDQTITRDFNCILDPPIQLPTSLEPWDSAPKQAARICRGRNTRLTWSRYYIYHRYYR